MPLFRKFQEGDLLVGVWKTEEDTEQLLALFDDPAAYKAGSSKYVSNVRRHEWLAVRALLKTLCGEEKDIGYYPSGKPFLKDHSGFISISHTRGYVAVALHPAHDIGIDIEQYGERVKNVASRFIRADEEPTILQEDEIYALLLHWSAKETLFKVMGAEGVDFVRHLHVLPFVTAVEGSFEACEYRTEEQKCYHVRYLTHPDFVLTWTVK